MILRILGSLLVVAALSVLGEVGAASLRERTATLRRLQSALEILQTEISFLKTPLPEALRRVGQLTGGAVAEFFIAAGRRIQDSGLPAERGWREALEEFSASTSLTAEDSEVLRGLGKTLGISDRLDQSRHLDLARERLAALEAQAREDEARNSRIYRYLGILSGLALVLLLL
ncbi:MAG: stage III sporulation protein AB [Bacillota bacterium]